MRQKVRLTPLLFLEKWAYFGNTDSEAKSKVNPFAFFAYFRTTDFEKSKAFLELPILRQKVRLTPLLFLEKWAYFGNTDFEAKSKVNPFAFFGKIGIFLKCRF